MRTTSNPAFRNLPQQGGYANFDRQAGAMGAGAAAADARASQGGFGPAATGERRLTIDDVVDVIHEEADEDIKRLGGVGDEELSDNVVSTVRSRFAWLFINLGTAMISASVIGLFDASIEKMIALAVLMPIVASMGGNAGTQTMTVTVRALATRDLDIYNAGRIIRREASVGIINGVMFATLLGLIAGLWFQNYQLGMVIGAAMIINLIAAALAGILLPLLLDKLGADPAIASSVFVTTVTDCTGFFAFLGIATWWFGIH